MLPEHRIREIAKRHKPKGWRVRESRVRFASGSGEADWNKKTLYVPLLRDEASLFIYLHEVGHVKRDHFHLNLATHVSEYEAEQYAIHVFRSEGVSVSRAHLKLARWRVNEWITSDYNRGIPITGYVQRWAQPKRRR